MEPLDASVAQGKSEEEKVMLMKRQMEEPSRVQLQEDYSYLLTDEDDQKSQWSADDYFALGQGMKKKIVEERAEERYPFGTPKAEPVRAFKHPAVKIPTYPEPDFQRSPSVQRQTRSSKDRYNELHHARPEEDFHSFLNCDSKVSKNANYPDPDRRKSFEINPSESDFSENDEDFKAGPKKRRNRPLRSTNNPRERKCLSKTSPRGSYNMLDLNQRIRIVNYAKKFNIEAAHKKFKVCKSRIKRYMKNGPGRKKGGGRKTLDPTMESKLLSWIEETSYESSSFPCRAQIKQKAKNLSAVGDFLASKGWCDKFFKRNQDKLEMIKKASAQRLAQQTSF